MVPEVSVLSCVYLASSESREGGGAAEGTRGEGSGGRQADPVDICTPFLCHQLARTLTSLPLP